MLRFKNIPGLATLAMLVLTLLVFNLGGWYLFELSRDLAEREQESKLAAVGRTAALELTPERTPLLMLAMPDTGVDPYTDWSPHTRRIEALRTRLAAIRDANGLQDVTILGRNMVVLVSSDEELKSGALVDLDAGVIDDAFTSGVVISSPYYRFQQSEYKRTYVPLVNRNGETIAALRVSAGHEYFAELNRMRAYLIAISGIGSLLLAFVAVALYRMLVAAMRYERAMADADRLQSLGTLATGIAHEIRNPLGIIRAISEELAAELEGHEEQRQMLADITGEVQRLNGLVTRFLTFAKPGDPGAAPEPFDLAETLKDVVQLVRKGSAKEDVAYDLEHHGKGPILLMEEKSIRQVLLNVLLNAREAVATGGHIAVTLDRLGRFARVRVRDDGHGMDERKAKRVFDPFFTTKPRGTGLGLSISRNIVERYGGRIWLESEEGKGTTVTVLLPVEEQGMSNRK